MSDRPVAAFVISLIGAIIGIVYSAILLYFLSIGSYMILSNINQMAPGSLSTTQIKQILGLLLGLFAWFLISSILVLIGAFMMYSGDPKKAKTGGILSIVFGILNLMNGAFIPLILGVIGGALGLSWSKEEERRRKMMPPQGEIPEFKP